MVRQGGLFRRGETERGDAGETYFQLTQAARTPRGSQRTSFFLYSIRRFVGRRSGRRAASPCLMVHCSFSAVTRISPKLASILVLPESRQATVAMRSWLLRMYLFGIVDQYVLGHQSAAVYC